MIAAGEFDEQHFRQTQVVDELALAGDERRILEPAQRPADPLRPQNLVPRAIHGVKIEPCAGSMPCRRAWRQRTISRQPHSLNKMTLSYLLIC